MSHYPDLPSLVYPWKAGTSIPFADFAPTEGPNGGRVVWDAVKIRIFGTIDTSAAGAWDGRDLHRLMSLITLEKRDGRNRWVFTGEDSRNMAIYLMGIENWIEHPTIAASSGDAVVDLWHVIPLALFKRENPFEFSLPGDMFRQLIIQCNSLTGAASGTAVLSDDKLQVQVFVEWHEETAYVDHKVDIVCKATDFTSQTQARLSLSGLLQDCLLTCPDGTAGGGAAITGITNIRCEDLSTPVLDRATYKQMFTRKRHLGPTGGSAVAAERFHDPVRDDKVLPFIVADEFTAPWDGKLLTTAKIDLGAGQASLRVLTLEVVAKSESDYNRIASDHGVSGADWGMVDAKGDITPLASGEFSVKQKKFGAWRAKKKPRTAAQRAA